MAWVNFFNVSACLPWTIYQTSVLVLWICLSVLLPSLRNSSEQESHRANGNPRFYARSCVWAAGGDPAWYQGKGRLEVVVVHPSSFTGLAVPVFVRVHGTAMGTQAAADSHPQMSPAAEHATRGMKGWSGKARLVGKHLGWNHASLLFWPLSKLLSFAVSAHSDSGTE